MHIIDNQMSIVAGFMRGLSELFEGEASNRNRIMYQAVIGWDPDQVGERCRLIDANGCDGVVAIFDPSAIPRGPKIVGVSITDRDMVRLELGSLWTPKFGRTLLVTREGRSHLGVERGRFVEHPGKPTRDLARGEARARQRLAQLAAEGRTLNNIVIVG
jgi:hypothetical protein